VSHLPHEVVSILPHEAKQNAWFYTGESGLDRTDDFQKFCGSGLDRIQLLRIRIGLGLNNFTVRSSLMASWHRLHFFIFTLHFSAFTINKLQSLPLWKFHTSSFDKMRGSWYPKFIHVFMGIHQTINNNQEDLKH